MIKKSSKKPRITVLVPAHNEGKILTKVLTAVKKIKDYDLTLLVVISNKASDATKKEAAKSDAKVINIGDVAGKGIAVREAIRHIKTPYVVQIDADYQFLPEEIPQMIEPLFMGYDVVLGTRYQKGSYIEPDSVTYLKLFGSYGLSFITTVFARTRVTDVMAGYKAFKTDVLKKLDPKTDHFGYEAELVVRAARHGYRIINVPISYKKRTVGSSSVSSIKHGLLVLETILHTAFEK